VRSLALIELRRQALVSMTRSVAPPDYSIGFSS